MSQNLASFGLSRDSWLKKASLPVFGSKCNLEIVSASLDGVLNNLCPQLLEELSLILVHRARRVGTLRGLCCADAGVDMVNLEVQVNLCTSARLMAGEENSREE